MKATTLLRPRSTKASQSGFSLITSLLLMLSVLLLGLAVMGVNVTQEKIIGNTRDRELAFQAAEAGLRDGERDVIANMTPTSAFVSNCIGGLCIPPSQSSTPNPKPVHEQSWFSWSDNTRVRSLGQITGAPAFPGVSTQPVYVIEQLGQLPKKNESVAAGGEPSGFAYRVTVMATGARPESQVILQSLFQKPN